MKEIIIGIITIINMVIVQKIWFQSFSFRLRELTVIGEQWYCIFFMILLKIMITFIVTLLMFTIIIQIDKKLITKK